MDPDGSPSGLIVANFPPGWMLELLQVFNVSWTTKKHLFYLKETKKNGTKVKVSQS